VNTLTDFCHSVVEDKTEVLEIEAARLKTAGLPLANLSKYIENLSNRCQQVRQLEAMKR
jgi:hypothetical protein